MKTIADAPYLDMFAEEFRTDPIPVMRALREQSWVVQTPIGGLVIGRAQVQSLLGDRRMRSSIPDIARMQGISEGPLFEILATSILALEGEDHQRVRRLVNRAFTPRAVDPHREDMRATLSALVDPVRDTGGCDFMAAIAEHYPIEVMCHLLGIPEEDHEDFCAWNKAITWALSFELAAHREEVEWGFSQMWEYVAALMADRRRSPKDDLVTTFVQAREGDDRLADDEIQMMIGGLLFAGYDTTRNQLGIAMWLFAEHPEQWKLLAADPSLAPRAVEEVMRFNGAVGAAPRVVAEDFELDGYRFEAGTILTLSTSSANHDPDAYVAPFTFDITVEREPHFTFGGGPHYCLGASLARAEMQEALPILAAAMPDLALDGEPVWRPPLGIFGPESLPIRYSSARSAIA